MPKEKSELGQEGFKELHHHCRPPQSPAKTNSQARGTIGACRASGARAGDRGPGCGRSEEETGCKSHLPANSHCPSSGRTEGPSREVPRGNTDGELLRGGSGKQGARNEAEPKGKEALQWPALEKTS